MRKLLFTILIFLFTVTLPSNAQFFNNNETGIGNNTEINNSSKDNSEEGDSGTGFFRSDKEDFEKPVIGEAIGETPIGDELSIMMLFSMFFGTIKVIKSKQSRFDKYSSRI